MYTKQQVAKTIDHAVLKPEMTDADLREHAAMCIKYNVFSICVKPCDVSAAKELLKDSDIKVSCVLSFPHGADTTPVKAFLNQGANRLGVGSTEAILNGAKAEGNY